MLGRARSLLLLPMVLVPMFGCAASDPAESGGHGGRGGAGGKADGGETLEERLASLAEAPLTYEAVDGILDLVAVGGTTTERMNEARAFFDGRTDPDASWDDEQTLAIEYGQTALNIFYISMPRDIVVAHGAAQSFDETTTSYDPDEGYGYAVPFYLTVSGDASAAYTLEFTIADSVLDVEVPSDTTAEDTAKLIADKIYDSNEEIFTNANSETFNTDSGEFPGLDDIGAEADGADVVIEPSING
jgi:hypothetical protein